MARTFNFITTGTGGGVQIDGGAIQYPINRQGLVKSNGNLVIFRIGDVYDQAIVGTDNINVDAVVWGGTADNLAIKLQGLFNVLGNAIGI